MQARKRIQHIEQRIRLYIQPLQLQHLQVHPLPRLRRQLEALLRTPQITHLPYIPTPMLQFLSQRQCTWIIPEKPVWQIDIL